MLTEGLTMKGERNDSLITLVQAHPELWNNWHQDFKNVALTKRLWKEIGKSLGITDEEARRKWKNLKDSYRKKLRKRTKTRTGRLARSSSKWRYFEMMSFTKSVLLHSKTEENLDQSPCVREAEENLEDKGNAIDAPASPISSLEPINPPLKRGGKRKKLNNDIGEPVCFLEEKKSNNLFSNEDESRGADYHFLMSLLPFIEPLSLNEKIDVWQGIQEVVYEAYKDHLNKVNQD